MKKSKIILIVSVTVLIAVIIWYLFFKEPKVETAIEEEDKPQSFLYNEKFPLQMGSKGDKVKQLQTAINKIDNRAQLSLDGVFGKITKDSLQAFLGGSYYPVTEAKFKYIIDFSNKI